MANEYDYEENGEYFVEDKWFECTTCKGTGYVNPLTAPEDFFCVGTTECPHCDGFGEV